MGAFWEHFGNDGQEKGALCGPFVISSAQPERLVQQPHHIRSILADPLRVVLEGHRRRCVPIWSEIHSGVAMPLLSICLANVCLQVFGPRWWTPAFSKCVIHHP